MPADAAASLVGSVLELEVGAVAHGGSCVARTGGRVVFVRHALPGERVRAVVTEDKGGSYLRADATEILAAHPDRVVAPCPFAGPGRCGGCDWQHASGALQRRLKADVIGEQFRRLAGLDVGELLAEVAELPGGLLGWRTRITYAVAEDGSLGLHKHRSSGIQRIDRCLIGADGVGDSQVLEQTWRSVTGVEVVRGVDGVLTVLEHRPGHGRHARGRRPPDRATVVSGPAQVEVEVVGQPMTVSAGGFWQVHPAAADAYAATVLDLLRPEPGESVLELFSGAGALTIALADAVGATGRVVAVESNAAAVADAARNLAARPQVAVHRARVDGDVISALVADMAGERPGEPAADLVVLDPPRAGVGAQVMTRLLECAPRAVAYVSCDPATLARDVRTALDAGWQLAQLRSFDAFPMTAHIECIALLTPAGS
jgi:tRNA/tmRNA/rRNA uracil-C5-methylase (TrmA/RlmC/RlmD family)